MHKGDLFLQKVLGAENPADIFTKYVDSVLMNKALLRMNLHVMEGRAKSAPATMGLKAPTQA